MNKISQQLIKIANELTSQENEEQLIQQLSQMSRQFTTDEVSQIIPINFDQATTDGIENLLNKYNSFLAQKASQLQEKETYLHKLEQLIRDASKYFDTCKNKANQIVNKCQRFKRVLSDCPKIRTKTTPKSQAFFRLRNLTE